ncbi:MAG: hypothetical protein WAW85_10600, partial [Gordonia sp. (in: high G+C Gram-positive bacteria)]
VPEAVVLDGPWWAQVVPAGQAVLVATHPDAASAAEFATLVDLPLASATRAVRVVSGGVEVDPDSAPVAYLAAVTGWDLTGPVLLHEQLVVAVFASDVETRHSVSRWRDETGVLHLQQPANWVP